MYLNFGYVDSLGQDCLHAHQALPKRDPSSSSTWAFFLSFLLPTSSNLPCSLTASTRLQSHAALSKKSHPEVMERIQVGTDRHGQAEPPVMNGAILTMGQRRGCAWDGSSLPKLTTQRWMFFWPFRIDLLQWESYRKEQEWHSAPWPFFKDSRV